MIAPFSAHRIPQLNLTPHTFSQVSNFISKNRKRKKKEKINYICIYMVKLRYYTLQRVCHKRKTPKIRVRCNNRSFFFQPKLTTRSNYTNNSQMIKRRLWLFFFGLKKKKTIKIKQTLRAKMNMTFYNGLH